MSALEIGMCVLAVLVFVVGTIAALPWLTGKDEHHERDPHTYSRNGR